MPLTHSFLAGIFGDADYQIISVLIEAAKNCY